MARLIAFYLPQFHPIPENDEWYGKGFTEWTNVAKAKPLFKGHYQPHIPADLGFYDLRLRDTIIAQVELAKKYGVDGFCYWHYWFGNGRRLLEKPFMSLVKDKTIDFPFSLAWANESWEKKLWDSKKKNEIIAKQEYLGIEDYKMHFYALLDAFKDDRYIRVDGKLFFIIYKPMNFEDVSTFIQTWRKLAIKEKIGDFYFVAKDAACRDREKLLKFGFDATYDDNGLNIHHDLSLFNKIRLKVLRDYFHLPSIFRYKDAIDHMILAEDAEENVIPLVLPNWDHSPRSGRKSLVFIDAKPEYFKTVLKKAFEIIRNKKPEHQLIMIRAWNEWGEGNHLEPDLQYGLGYLEAIMQAREEENI